MDVFPKSAREEDDEEALNRLLLKNYPLLVGYQKGCLLELKLMYMILELKRRRIYRRGLSMLLKKIMRSSF